MYYANSVVMLVHIVPYTVVNSEISINKELFKTDLCILTTK